MHKVLGPISLASDKADWWHNTVRSVLEKYRHRQRDKKFKAIFNSIVGLRSVWATGDSVSEVKLYQARSKDCAHLWEHTKALHLSEDFPCI